MNARRNFYCSKCCRVQYNDIDFSVDIDLMDGIFKWKEIEKRLNEMIKYPEKIFPNYPITNKRKPGTGQKQG